jgi:predicted AAA+ superfamily ATPase
LISFYSQTAKTIDLSPLFAYNEKKLKGAVMIDRPQYIQKLITLKDKRVIKIITGARRCGKSTIFILFQDYLKQNGVAPEQIQSINLEDVDNRSLTDYVALHDHIKNLLVPNKMNYIFLDEIQNVKDFQKAADSLFIKENVDLYLTGSNSHILSGEWADMLSGRYMEIQMFPLSFKEYLSAFDDNNAQEHFKNYLKNGSFPYTLNFEDDASIKDYLGGIYSSVILKDIISHKKIIDIMQLESVIKFMFSNIGSETSIHKIKNTIISGGKMITHLVVENYVQALLDSFIFYRALRFDIKGKQYLKTNEKYYIVDTGLRSFLIGSDNTSTDEGHILENVVYIELLRRGYKVYVGKIGTYEVDFVAVKNDQRQYYQVALTTLDQNVLDRELRSLNNIKDHNQKFLLTMDYLPQTSYNGIKKINVIDWLRE